MQIPKCTVPNDLKPLVLATKIGFVWGHTREHVDKRKSELNTGNPFKLKVDKAFPCNDPLTFEEYWHMKFKSCHQRGEWFHLSPQQIHEIETVMEEYHETGTFAGDKKLWDSLLKKNETKVRRNSAKKRMLEGPLSKRSFQLEIKGILKEHRQKIQSGAVDSRSYLSDEDQIKVRKALSGHPEADEKIGCGVRKIFVKQSKSEYRTYCFFVTRTDGSEEEFSYKSCFVPKQSLEGSGKEEFRNLSYGNTRA